MRKQSRPPEPSVLTQHAERMNKEWSERKTADKSAAFRWNTVEGKSIRDHILPTLREMNQGHCSFCDGGPLEAVSMEPIEHFRPKGDSRFYALAFDWRNLFYCCDRCQSTKREQWDDNLLNPDAPEYNFDDYFDFDSTTGAIEPKVGDPANELRAAATIRLYGLDSNHRRRYRRLELEKWLAAEPSKRQIDEWSYRDYLERPLRNIE